MKVTNGLFLYTGHGGELYEIRGEVMDFTIEGGYIKISTSSYDKPTHVNVIPSGSFISFHGTQYEKTQ